MSIQHFGKSALRVAKNYTKGYSDVQSKVREATSNDAWGPSGTQMNEIAQMTFNQNDFVEIMEMLDKRLNDKGKNWRHVFKALTLLDYLLHAGSENVVIYFRDNMYVVKTLKEFQYVDEYAKDQGANVRQKAKEITNLLMDEARLRQERRSRAHMRDRMVGGVDGTSGTTVYDEQEGGDGGERRQRRGAGGGEGDDDFKRAIEESKRSAMQEEARARQTAEERDLAKAIQLSEEEEAKRKNAVEDSNARALFDDQQQLAPPSTNPFPLVDPNQGQFGNGLQPQFTQIQPQFTAFNPYQQQAMQEAMQQEYLRQQQEWMQQQQQLQAQQQQAQQEEWMRQQQMMQMQQQQQQQQQLMAQPTGFGSNNPFALNSGSPPPMPNQQTQPNLSSFSLPSTFDQHPVPSPQPQSMSPPQPTTSAPPAVRTRPDGEHAHLANLLANRDDGQDTFGNIGALRYGNTQAGLYAQQTGAVGGGGSNPFQRQQQQQSSEQPFFSI